MISIKTKKEIEIMTNAGAILANVMRQLLTRVKPDVSELELDHLAEKLICEQGGEPGFKRVAGYHHTICVATNDVVVHGIPTAYPLQEGDIIGIDCGVFLNGFHTDAAETVRVSEILNSKFEIQNKEDKIDRFLRIGKEALHDAIAQVKPGKRVGNISRAIQDKVEREGGYSVTLSLIGHGVGRELHEEPEVPGYLDVSLSDTPILKPGMTIAVEVIYNMGGSEVVNSNQDNWTIKTKDGSISAVFERTVLVTQGGHKVLTIF